MGHTVALDRVVGDPAEHGESALLAEAEALLHPREEVCEREVPSAHTLGDPRRATREGQGADTVGSEGDVERFTRARLDGRKDVARGVIGRRGRPEHESRVKQLQSRDFDADRELLGNVLPHRREEFARGGEDDERSRLGDLEVDRLSSGRVCRIYQSETGEFPVVRGLYQEGALEPGTHQ